ncbi:alpha/beta hydrolase family protein [Phyllobacterium leguminum]|nr:dienelactone hydrolase [Phyllobacterium leguminum]
MLAFGALTAPCHASDVGVRQIMAPSKARGINLDVTVWYPAGSGGAPVTLGESAFFKGTPAMRDAPIADGKFPLILLSHGAGLGGNPQVLNWLAAPLAKKGFIVAAPTHPRNSGPNRSVVETIKLWLRPSDLTDTLNAVEKNSFFKAHLQGDKVGALGLSMGGGTVLTIAGARMVPQRLASYCDTDELNPSFCGWVRDSGVDLHSMDFSAAGGDYEDKRIRFVMALDPTPIDVFDIRSFSKISIPVELINMGQPGKLLVSTDASKITKAIPEATYVAVKDASHYSLLPECKPGAAELAESEKIGDPICSDGGGVRNEIHAQLIDMVVAAFSRGLKAGR